MSMWNGPSEIEIDDLYLIIGPNIDKLMSHDDSYINDYKPEDEEFN